MSEKKYDLSFLKKVSNEDQAFIIDMLETFRNIAPGIVNKMEIFLNQKKYEALSREAHRFIPGITFLGVKDLERDLIDIEEKAKNLENLESLPEILLRVRKEVESLIQCFTDDFNLRPC
ncbi:MAG: Hpt domain-containing protein [Bacteroidales bacterium]|nr:Hpt domain-containing protein [Bacteroidales bacterium]